MMMATIKPVQANGSGVSGWRSRYLKRSSLYILSIILVLCKISQTDAEILSRLPLDPILMDSVVGTVDDFCGKTKLCNQSLGKRSAWRCTDCADCYCDDMCHIYGDCCLDKYFTLSVESENLTWTKYLSCVSFFNSTESIHAISRCPEQSGVSLEIVAKCHTPDLNDVRQATVVSDVSTNVHIVNEYCAKCHGIKAFQVWTNSVSCRYSPYLSSVTSKEELWKYILRSPNCTIKVVPPNGVTARTCNPNNHLRTCNSTGLWTAWNQTTEELCNSFYSPMRYFHHSVPIDSQKKWYANVFCILCDGFEFDAFRPPFCKDPGGGRIEAFAAPLSVLLDFRPKETRIEIQPRVNICPPHEVFDPFQGICIMMRCTDRRVLTDNQCQPTFSGAQWLGYDINITLTTPKHPMELRGINITILYETMIREKLSEYHPFIFTPIKVTAYENIIGGEEGFILLVEGRFASNCNKTTASLEEIFKKLGSEPWIVLPHNVTNHDSVVKRETAQVIFHPKFSSCSPNISPGRELTTTYAVDPYQILTPLCDQTCFERIQYVNIEHILNCPFLDFNITNPFFKIQTDPGELIFENGSVSLTNADYFLCGNSVKICVSVIQSVARVMRNFSTDIEQVQEESNQIFVLTIVSIVCNLVSLVCLLLTLVTFVLLPKLRTLPGKNTMSLVIYLFLAQLMFLIGIRRTENCIVCQVFGILIHFLWVAAFAWMAVCAFHMYKVFTDLLASRHHRLSERTILFRYYVVSNLTAVLTVLACVAYHLISSNAEQTGYGGLTCFISNRIALGVAFGGPLALVLVLNVFFFVRTIMSIRNIPNLKNSRHNCNRSDVTIYFRLSALLGLTWILAFLNNILDEQSIYISYMFEILTGCQGLFIFIAFCLSGRTIGLYKDKFSTSSPKQNGSHPHTDSTTL